VESFGALVREAKASKIHLELGYPSWPAYFVSVVGGVMPKLRIADRREIVALLAGTGLSDYAISKALGIGYSTVARDLTLRPAAERTDVVGLDGKRYKAQKIRGRKPAKPRADRKAAKLQSAAQGLQTAIAEFLATLDGCSPAKAKALAAQVLGDANHALGSLEQFFEWLDQIPGSLSHGSCRRPGPLELVGIRTTSFR
jgi:transposase